MPVLIEQRPPPMRLRGRKVSVTSRLAGEARQEFLSKQSDHILKDAGPPATTTLLLLGVLRSLVTLFLLVA